MSLLHLGGGGSSADDKLYVEDVFSTYLYTGNSSTQTINNGIDLAGKGGLVWTKTRNYANSHSLQDTIRGVSNVLSSNFTTAASTHSNSITSFNSNGYSLGADPNTWVNGAGGRTYTSWTFRKAPKFFDIVTYTGNSVSGRQIPHNLGCEVGMIIVKIISATTEPWVCYHKSLGATQFIRLNETATAQTWSGAWNNTEPTAQNFTVGGSLAVNSSGQTYVAYLFAHDPSADGIIQCGSFTTDGSGNATVNLGWEPQYLMVKRKDAASNWLVMDVQRGMSYTGINPVYAESPDAENPYVGNVLEATASGFNWKGALGSSAMTIIYLAIRRPMKVPTSGTQVYNAIARTGTGAVATVTGVGFSPDLAMFRGRASGGYSSVFVDKLRGVVPFLLLNTTESEATNKIISSFNMDGISVDDSTGYINASGVAFINHFFKRAKGFMDIVCYTGTGVARTVKHNLGVVPELMIVKSRSTSGSWAVWYGGVDSWNLLNGDYATQTGADFWNNQSPTATLLNIGTNGNVNTSPTTYVAYLFATLAGVQWISSYVGDGTTGRVINCGFTSGARFICIKAMSTTGNWWIFDSSRGILAAADPVLALNSTVAEITSADAIDPHSSGFIVNQEATCSINASGVSYLVWAIA